MDFKVAYSNLIQLVLNCSELFRFVRYKAQKGNNLQVAPFDKERPARPTRS